MSDPIADAVASAMAAVMTALPSLSMTMEAGGFSASVVLASGVDGESADVRNGPTITTTRKVVAKVVDFPSLAVGQIIALEGRRHVITDLRKSGEAAWSVSLSRELETVAVRLVRGAKFSATVSAYAYDFALDDPMSDVDVDPGLIWTSVRISIAELEGMVPGIKDIVEFTDGRTLRVAKVASDGETYNLTCRGRR